MNMTPEIIESLSYTDFVALINQTNVPPGSYSTLTKWKVNSGLSEKSHIFEVACTTGFSILNLIQQAQCTGVGVDISKTSIQRAIRNASELGLSSAAEFQALDATLYDSSKHFTHIVVGAGLGFFDQPHIMIRKMEQLFENEGFLLASPFYVTQEIPDNLIHKAKSVFGITPTNIPYKEVMKLYKGFDVYFEDRENIEQETENELSHYCESTVDRACEIHQIEDGVIKECLYHRLYEIKKMSNDLRPYQGYSVNVFHYNRKTFPNRYVELF